MALFDSNGPQTLSDVLGQQADTAAMGIEQGYAKKRRQSVAQQAAGGRLRSGVSNYTAGDINASELGDLGQVQSSLADALATIPTNDLASSNEYERNMRLAELIGRLNKPNDLQSILGGATSGAGAGAAFGPYGALAGGALGAFGGYASS